MGKTTKFLLSAVGCLAGFFLIDCLLGGVGYRLAIVARQVLPFPFIGTACVQLPTIIAIGFVGFVSGGLFYVRIKTVCLAAMTYIAVSLFYKVYVLLELTNRFSFSAFAILLVTDTITLAFALLLAWWSCSVGRKLREITTNPTPLQS